MTKDIKVFTTPTCVYCSMVKRYLKQKGVEFDNVDLTKHPKWINRMVTKSGMTGVPQLWIDEDVIVGYNVPAINRSLGL